MRVWGLAPRSKMQSDMKDEPYARRSQWSGGNWNQGIRSGLARTQPRPNSGCVRVVRVIGCTTARHGRAVNEPNMSGGDRSADDISAPLPDTTSERLGSPQAGEGPPPATVRAPNSPGPFPDPNHGSARSAQTRPPVADFRSEDALRAVASDLNEIVVSGVFEAGLVLEGARLRCSDPQAVQLIDEAVAILDETIARARALVFSSDGNDMWERQPDQDHK